LLQASRGKVSHTVGRRKCWENLLQASRGKVSHTVGRRKSNYLNPRQLDMKFDLIFDLGFWLIDLNSNINWIYCKFSNSRKLDMKFDLIFGFDIIIDWFWFWI
jgi:hypothetical protein